MRCFVFAVPWCPVFWQAWDLGKCGEGGAEKGKPESEGGLTRCEEVKVKRGPGGDTWVPPPSTPGCPKLRCEHNSRSKYT